MKYLIEFSCPCSSVFGMRKREPFHQNNTKALCFIWSWSKYFIVNHLTSLES